MTVRAINNIEFGPLALTVCHAQPYAVDTTAPIIYAVDDIKYDEDTFQISCRVNATYVLLFLTNKEYSKLKTILGSLSSIMEKIFNLG